ncbi:hypothetical protein BDM02DRAFT_3091388 [Thelephora ganbajun]|uniref:Uncharacterized protein n=1 Tax=Thelephora ganbajun TaxID=370292 RepID=A0ACB6ZPE5_THEGA|nr:hypothetical protein BDM02DRAFT_3091388 [Thelephora ganbajun]
MRSVVLYDDLEQITTTPVPIPPAKKRKRQQNKRKSLGSQKFAHWDEPVEKHVTFTGHDYTGDLEDETVDGEGHELTHEEIWDDSALIEAWDTAMNEYKAFHGSEDEWKAEPTSKPSPLWYNVPPSASSTTDVGSGSKLLSPIHEKQDGHAMSASEHDSIPLNFNTFVPSHDPALANPAATDTQNLTGISQDEAFRNALNAMYWTGYWTAVYHVRVSLSLPL